MTVLGLTGGSGTGKTTALGVLAERGATVIDCDAVYHELVAAGGLMIAELAHRFPGVVENGRLQRKALGQIVFHDPAALADLNVITHKYVCQAVDDRLTALALHSPPWRGAPQGWGGSIVAIEAIALIESGLNTRCDLVVGILAPADERIRRITAREGIDPAYAQSRIESQKPDEWFRTHCDHIIENAYPSPAAFAEACRRLFDRIL